MYVCQSKNREASFKSMLSHQTIVKILLYRTTGLIRLVTFFLKRRTFRFFFDFSVVILCKSDVPEGKSQTRKLTTYVIPLGID